MCSCNDRRPFSRVSREKGTGDEGFAGTTSDEFDRTPKATDASPNSRRRRVSLRCAPLLGVRGGGDMGGVSVDSGVRWAKGSRLGDQHDPDD